MKSLLTIPLLFLLTLPVQAGEWYTNVKVGVHWSRDTINEGDGSGQKEFRADNPLFSLEVGYREDEWGIEFEHISSILQKDVGINMINVTYRIW